MNVVEQKKIISDRLYRIQKLLKEKQIDSLYEKELQHLIEDVNEEHYYVTILGEFKRGKSTLTNALIGKDILPSDVTPTTATINLIHHGEEEHYTIHFEDGTSEQKKLQQSELKKLTFLEGENFAHIHHVDIVTPFEKMNEHIIFVDTPGVGDLNEHRIDVTYSYIPRSSAVIFVIDCSTPLRRTELEYLQHHVIPNLHGELIIVANFYDRIDEEEWEEAEEYITRKLKKTLGNIPYVLLPIAAIENIDGEWSFEFKTLTKTLNKLAENGHYSELMLQHFENRAANVIKKIEKEIIQITNMQKANEDELREAMAKIESFKQNIVQYQTQVEQYLQQRKHDVWAIVKKSIQFFEKRLTVNIQEQIEDYPGGNFKNFIETNIPKQVKMQMDSWVSNYTPNVHILIEKVENQTYASLEQLLNQTIRSDMMPQMSIRFNGEFGRIHVEGKDDSGTMMTGGIAAGGSAVLLLLGAGPLVPIVAFGGLPLLNKYIGENKLKAAKAEALPNVLESVTNIVHQLNNRLERYVDSEFNRIEKEVIQNLRITLQKNFRRLEMELQTKQRRLTVAPQITLKEFEDVK